MIRIVRAPEPARLVPERERRLVAARADQSAGRPTELSGYELVKDELFAMQRNKCCYCEKREEQAKFRDVEHFRPKARYWWLAWTWENLLFACIDCNREYKRDQFPLASGGTALIAEQRPPGAELPLLIDPTDPASDPFDEMEFRRETIHGRERWRPYGRTPRGWETIRVCGLDRAGLLDLYTEHVVALVRPKLEPVFQAIRRADARAVVTAWETAKRGLLGPERPFRGLSHDALQVLVPAEARTRYNLGLARPTG